MKRKIKTLLIMMIVLLSFTVINIGIVVTMKPYLFWRTLEFEYIDQLSFNYNDNYSLECKLPAVYNDISCVSERNYTYIDGPNFWFYEVTTEDEWRYFCELMGIEDDYVLEFPNNYVISISREITDLYCNNIYWNTKKYGSLVRADFDMEKFEKSKIYIYRLNEEIVFYYNARDWDLGNYNMDECELRNADTIAKPFLEGPFIQE